MIKQRAVMMTLGMLALAGSLLPAACTAGDDAPEIRTDNREVPLTIGEASLSASLTGEGGLTRAAATIDNLRLLYTFNDNEGKSLRNNTLYKLSGDAWNATSGEPILVDARKGTVAGIYYAGTPEDLPVSETGGIPVKCQPYSSSKIWYYQKHTDVNNGKAALDFNSLACKYSRFSIQVSLGAEYPEYPAYLQRIAIQYGSKTCTETEYNPLSDKETNPVTGKSYTQQYSQLISQPGKPTQFNFLLVAQSQENTALTVTLTIDGKDYTATVSNFAGFTGMKTYTLPVTLKGAELVVGGIETEDWIAGHNADIGMQ